MMLATHVDPRGMIRVFEKLEEEQQRQFDSMNKDEKKADPEKKDSVENDSKKTDKEVKDSDKKGGAAPPEWTQYLSTHPEGNNRVEVLKKMAKASTAKPRPLLPDFDWKSMHRETKESGFIF